MFPRNSARHVKFMRASITVNITDMVYRKLTVIMETPSLHEQQINERIAGRFCLQDSDSAGTKFEGALINAAIFVVIVGVMTFVLFLLFKYGVRSTAHWKDQVWRGWRDEKAMQL